MKEFDNCPNCKEAFREAFFNSNHITPSSLTDFINEFSGIKAEAFCDKCKGPLVNRSRDQLHTKLNLVKNSLQGLINDVPVITLQNPRNWDFQVMDMVTAQSVTGTGVVSEISSSISDLFGSQSNRLNTKLKNGEDICKTQIRLAAVSLGANAVIALDIDYAEVGGDKGMLMVCMAGTAIRLNNPEVLGETYMERFEELDKVAKQNADYARYRRYLTNS